MKSFFDFDDLENPKERRERLLAEAAERQEQENRVAAQAKARVDETTRRANAIALVREYQRAGVDPPFTNGHGIPTVSLSLLLKTGWTIQRLGPRDAVLLKPEAIPPGRLQSEV